MSPRIEVQRGKSYLFIEITTFGSMLPSAEVPKVVEAKLIGNSCLIASYVHVAHDCQIGNNVIIAHGTGIAGHVTVEDSAVFGGLVGVHQFTKVGRMAMIGAHTMVTKDVPPYLLVDGNPAKAYGINIVGLRRNGLSPEVRASGAPIRFVLF